MLSKSKISFIKSLSIKKFRNETGLFIVEGVKMVDELINSSFEIKEIYATEKWEGFNSFKDITLISEKELTQVSSLKTPNQVLAIAAIPERKENFEDIFNTLSIALDDVKDPGNLGTIIRLADWFGIKNVFCSLECVDAFNPKVVQATMGSLFRVNINYVNLPEFLKNKPTGFPIYGAVLGGEDIYQNKLSETGIIVMGNESSGISDNILPLITEKITIPSYGSGAESLNVAIATAIICAEFRRKTF